MKKYLNFIKFHTFFRSLLFSRRYTRNTSPLELFETFHNHSTNEQHIASSLGQQPYYFELVARNMVTRKNQKSHGNFRFELYKNSQRVDFSKQSFPSTFTQRRMNIPKARLNFFLPNYIPGKNYNSKFTLSLIQSHYGNAKLAGSYIIDPNIYIEQFKRTGRNYYAEIWDLSEDYSMEVQLFFDESRYALEKLLGEHRDNPATSFAKPLVSKAIEQAKKAEIQEDKEYDDEERYNDQRMKLFNKYAGALVGHGGYRIFEDEAEKIVKKESELKKSNNRYDLNKNQPISTPSRSKMPEQAKKTPNSNHQSIKKGDQKTLIKPLTDNHDEVNPEAEMRNIKFFIIGIVILILLGSGYFLSKIFLKDQVQSVEVPKAPKAHKEFKKTSDAPKKAKAKGSKKPKVSSEL